MANTEVNMVQPESVALDEKDLSNENSENASEVKILDDEKTGREQMKPHRGWREFLGHVGRFLLFHWFKLLYKRRRMMLIIWILLLAVAAFFSVKAFGATSWDTNPVSGTNSYEAWQLYKSAYGEDADTSSLLVLVQASGNLTSLLDDEHLYQLSIYINSSLASQRDASENRVVSIEGYFLLDADLAPLTSQYLSTDNASSYIVISYFYDSYGVGTTVQDLLKSFVYNSSNNYIPNAAITTGVTGLEIYDESVTTSIEQDLIIYDSIALVAILVAFYIFFRKFRFLILPVLNFFSAFCFALGLLYPIELATAVSSIAISIMITMGLAFSTDYTLFFVSRFLDELKKNRRRPEAAAAMSLHFVGEIVVTSGTVLMISFLFLLIYKDAFIRGVGIGVSLISMMTIIVNLSVTPLIILNFPKFFSKNLVPSDSESLQFDAEKQKKHFWFRLASLWSSKRNAIICIVVVLVLSAPFIVFACQMNTTIDSTLLTPRGSEGIVTYNNFVEAFSAGLLAPYYVLINVYSASASNPNQTTISSETWNLTSALVSELDASMGLQLGTEIFAFIEFGGEYVPWYAAEMMFDPNSTVYDNETSILYRYVYEDFFSIDLQTTEIMILTDFNPTSDDAMTWIPDMRTSLDNFLSDYSDVYGNYDLYLWGGVVINYDSVQTIKDQFPFTVATCFAILLILVGLTFRSVLIPIRSVLTIGLSVGWAYGILVVIFQKIIGENIYWLTPVMTFSIIIGLGMDYDIFLISKIREYVEDGFNTRAAIVKGVYRTGNLITGAGIIMAISFAGQLFSSITLLNQIGTVLVSSVLLDTFLVRTSMVPAILHLIGDWNWWPGLKFQDLQDRDKDVEESIQTKPGEFLEKDYFVDKLIELFDGHLEFDHDNPEAEHEQNEPDVES
jgi:RND superfamily putative drug exporter